MDRFKRYKMNAECRFCSTRIDDVVNLGEVKKLKNVVVHYYCLLLATTVEQRGRDNEGILGFLLDDIWKEIHRCGERICCYCNRPGASVFCSAKTCKSVFHLPCGIRNGTGHQFHGSFLSMCHIHRQRQKYNIPHTKKNCPICYEVLDFRRWRDIIWAPCCKANSYFHKPCVQKMALSAGYFFKCPVCNDKDKFHKTMKNFGVFIPDRDASWEIEPNAFHELYVRHSECNSPECFCSRGNKYSGSGQWEIILCNTCGSQGRHAACLPDADDSAWICQDCTIIKDPNAPPPTLNIPCTSTQDDSRKRKIECVDENEEIDVIELSDSDDDPGVTDKKPASTIVTRQGTFIPVHIIKQDFLKLQEQFKQNENFTQTASNCDNHTVVSDHSNYTQDSNSEYVEMNDFSFGFKITNVRTLAEDEENTLFVNNNNIKETENPEITEADNCLVVRNGDNETTIKCKSNKTSVKEAFYSAIKPNPPALISNPHLNAENVKIVTLPSVEPATVTSKPTDKPVSSKKLKIILRSNKENEISLKEDGKGSSFKSKGKNKTVQYEIRSKINKKPTNIQLSETKNDVKTYYSNSFVEPGIPTIILKRKKRKWIKLS